MNNVDPSDLKHSALLKYCKELQETLRGAYSVAQETKADRVLKYLKDKEMEPVTILRITAEELPQPKIKSE